MTQNKMVIPFPELFQEVVEGVFCLPVYAEKSDYDLHYSMIQHQLYRIDAKDAEIYKELISSVKELCECTALDAVRALRSHSFWQLPMMRVERELIDYKRDR